MFMNVVNMFHDYMGSGLMILLFMAAVIYLCVMEQRKIYRILFVYVPVLILLCFFNPLFAKVMLKLLGTEIYYRILWLIPFTMVIGYSGVDLYGRLQGMKQTVYLVCLIGIIMISGSFIYQSSLFHKAENQYHMPQEVVDLCDAIVIPGREVMAVFPAELLQYVRQYTALVRMPYGREMIVERWNFDDKLYDAMEAKRINAQRLSVRARERMCHYIILPKEKQIIGDLTEYDYVLYDSIGDYVIYKDSRVELEIPK